ncbi:barstar family protein [Streptomyces hiroshimensis]|uniref:barstar family protein n=1 Tax=Streptomyces hiroshimensis TaxID=66424 RepID=UPI001E388EA3|nr:barstar family protein [Streptomyces hiroshimensis]
MSGPWLHVLPRTAVGVLMDFLPPTGATFVGRLDGAKMGDTDGVFEQFWDRFRFPDYFGWNWHALSDCLRDLHWMRADRYLVVIENSSSLLSGVPEDVAVFLSVLKEVVEHWRNPHMKPGNVAIPFAVLLLCEPDEADPLRAVPARVESETERPTK